MYVVVSNFVDSFTHSFISKIFRLQPENCMAKPIKRVTKIFSENLKETDSQIKRVVLEQRSPNND